MKRLYFLWLGLWLMPLAGCLASAGAHDFFPCDSGLCTASGSPAPGVDGGFDAGGLTDGGFDAGKPTDGGSDAGAPFDAGTPDGGLDAGSDAGLGPFLCRPPDAGWPLHCGAAVLAFTNPNDNISDLAIAPLGAGAYLLGYTNNATSGNAFVTVLADGGIADAGTLTYPIYSLALVGGVAPTLVTGVAEPNCASSGNGCTLSLACEEPYTATPASYLQYKYDSTGPSYAEVDYARAARGPLGLGIAWADTIDLNGANTGYALLGFGSGGGCPTQVTELPAPAGAGLSLNSISIVGTDGGFAVARTYQQVVNEILVLDLLPDGGEQLTTFGSGVYASVSLASPALAVVQDFDAGVALYSPGDAGLSQVVSLSAGLGGIGLSAAGCGNDCAAAIWADPISASQNILQFSVRYAFVNAEGCGVEGAFAPVAMPPSSGGPIFASAVAAQPGSALFAYAVDQQGSSEVHISYCTP